MSAGMTLTALLVCVDQAAADVLRRVLVELSIHVELCQEFSRAAMRLAQDRFDVVIVDGESNAEVIALLRDTRLSRINDATLAIAVVSGQESIREMFSLGVNFVLYKPVAYERAVSSLRAARAVMRKEKRKNARAAVHAHATVDFANMQQENATLIDLAQDGMQVRFGKKIPSTGKVYFQFKLPSQSTTIRLSGQLIWQDWNGRAGVQFVDVPKASRRLMTEFLSANLPRHSAEGRLPDVTVEIEEAPQMAVVTVAEQTHGEKAPAAIEISRVEIVHDAPAHHASAHHITEHERATSAQAESQKLADADNRRTQTRYACRLGAEVYRTGTSVPNRCCLTDLSSGGCYLEVSLPFPSGSTVEIVVRTYEMKLHLHGTVLASHPGYGMGIGFELKGKQEQESVKKLLDFVAATTESSN
jgi:response regulator of citrate/malate metabolism